jgi:type I restriction enzyme S subunit
MSNLSNQVLVDLIVTFPPLLQQKRIVFVLKEIFGSIATAVANAQKNLHNARDLFASYLNFIFSQKNKGWFTKSLEELGRLQTGTTPKTSDESNLGIYIPFIKPGDFRTDGSLDYENEGLSELGLAQSRLIPSGSAVMVCIGATIGKAGFVEQDISANQQVNAVTPCAGISGKFLYYQMTSARFQNDVLDSSAQATLPIVNKSKWGRLVMSLPNTIEEQERIVTKLDELCAEVQRVEEVYLRKVDLLVELRPSILQKAFAGELAAQPGNALQEAMA